MSSAKEKARRCLEELRARGRASGQMARAEVEAGVAEGYLRKAMYQNHGHGISLERFFTLLEGLNLSPRLFFSTAFADDDSGSLRELVDSPNEPPPTIVENALQFASRQAKGTLGRSYLLRLDDLRYDDPTKALHLAEDAIEFVSYEDLPLVLGVFASACRPLLRLDQARHSLRAGLEIAELLGDRQAAADLVLRSATLQVSAGCYRRALLASEQAGLLYVRAGNLKKFGCTLVDQGIALLYLDQLDDSALAFRSSLELLAQSDHRNHFTAFQVLGLIAVLQKQPSRALELLEQSREFATNQLEQGKLAWVEGGAFSHLGKWQDAFWAFETAIDSLLSVSPVDAALCLCDHVRSLCDAGRLGEAVERAEAMRRIVVPLEDVSVVAAAAARDLLLFDLEGKRRLTTRAILEVKRRIGENQRKVSVPPTTENV